MHVIDLNGPWQFRGEDPTGLIPRAVRGVTRWMPATVPGTVHTDLMALGKIPDPFYRMQEKDVQWVDGGHWVYRTVFDLPLSVLEEEHIDLIAEGLDTFATITVNGTAVGNARNMFIAHRFDIRNAIVAGRNVMEIAFASPVASAQALEAEHGKLQVALESHRVYTRKAQYSFGWDWGPKLTTSGIWRPMRIEAYSHARLRHPVVRVASIAPGAARLAITVDVEGLDGKKAELEVRITGHGEEVLVHTVVDTSRVSVECILPEPKLWWPHGAGAQPLYTAVLALREGEDVIDAVPVVFGVRTVRLLQEADEEGQSFIMEINGRKIFCKGADWIPADTFLPRVTDDKYERLLTMARDASMNMIRVWGGGIYEQDRFYELCDRLGLMVWQDFMFACGEYPEIPSFLEDVRHEAEEVVQRLRNHASIVLWCGNNECEWLYCNTHPGKSPDKMRGATIFRDLLPSVVDALDGTRPYWRSTPFGDGFPNAEGNGNHHEWDVWSAWKDYAGYRDVKARFVSEFGFQGPPDRRTMERVMDPADRSPQSAVMEHHNKQVEGPERLFRFMAAHFNVPSDWASYFHTGQLLQAEALRCAVEHWRRRKYRTAGALFWQLNDCWPVTSWAVIDGDMRPKAAYHFARRFFAPTLISFAERDGQVEVWGTHDGTEDIEGRLAVEIRTLKGALVWREFVPVTMQADSSQVLCVIPAAALQKADPSTVSITAELVRGSRHIAGNRHFLREIKHLQLPRARLTVSVKVMARGLYRARVRTNAFAIGVALSMERGEAEFRDNWFTLEAGETHEVEFTSALAPAAARRAIAARALNSR
jgi:beta-mannosidase